MAKNQVKLPSIIFRIQSPKDYQSKCKSYNDMLHSVYRTSRLFGQLPFSIKYKTNEEIYGSYIGFFDAIWFLISITIYLSFFYLTCTTIDLTGNIQSMLIFIISRLILMADLLLSASAVIFDMINRSRLIKIVKDLKRFDDEVNHCDFLFLFFLKSV